MTRISKEHNNPIIEITESGCGYLDAPFDKKNGRIPDSHRIEFFREELAGLARLSPMVRVSARSTHGACSTTLSGQMAIRSAMA